MLLILHSAVQLADATGSVLPLKPGHVVAASLHQQLVTIASVVGKGYAQPNLSELEVVWLPVVGCAGTLHLYLGGHSGSPAFPEVLLMSLPAGGCVSTAMCLQCTKW